MSFLAPATTTRARRFPGVEPIARIDPVGQFGAGIPSIGTSNWAGRIEATDHLLGLGHRHIATITGRHPHACAQARLDGYRAALARAGIAANSALVAEGTPGSSPRWHQRVPEPQGTTGPMIAGSDVPAMGMYEAARRHGLLIPEDPSVIGFDEIPSAAWMASATAYSVRSLCHRDTDESVHNMGHHAAALFRRPGFVNCQRLQRCNIGVPNGTLTPWQQPFVT